MADGEKTLSVTLQITPARHDLRCDYENLAANEDILLQWQAAGLTTVSITSPRTRFRL